MKKLLQLTFLEFKILFRSWLGMIATFILPIFLLCFFVILSKNVQINQEYHFVDVYLPSTMVMVMIGGGITFLAFLTSNNQELKTWSLYRIRGFCIYRVAFVQLLVNVALQLLISLLLLVIAVVFFQARIPSDFKDCFYFIGTWILGALSVSLIGFLIGLFVNPRNVNNVTFFVTFFLMIFSGQLVWLRIFSEDIRNIISYLPTTQTNALLTKIWTNLPEDIVLRWEVLVIWIFITLSVLVYKLKR